MRFNSSRKFHCKQPLQKITADQTLAHSLFRFFERDSPAADLRFNDFVIPLAASLGPSYSLQTLMYSLTSGM
jgi:hypothetical protein